MNKVICICGKICSGKTSYAKKLAKKEKAIILSIDEVTYDLINNEQGKLYDDLVIKIGNYLKKKAIEIVKNGANVILDWGFWSKKDRYDISNYFKNNNINYIWHYIEISDKLWHESIQKRNNDILKQKNKTDFFINDGLFKKFLGLFEEPNKDEIDIWYKLDR